MQDENEVQLKFKSTVKVIVTDKDHIGKLQLDGKVAVISFYENAVPKRFTDGLFLSVHMDMDIINHRYHPENFSHQDEAAKKIADFLATCEDADYIVYQCNQGEYRSRAAASGWLVADIDPKICYFNGKMVPLEDKDFRGATSYIRRFSARCMDDIHEATFN